MRRDLYPTKGRLGLGHSSGGCASPYRGDPLQSPGCAALKGRPNPGNTNRHTTPNHRTSPNHHTSPNRHTTPDSRISPYRGDPLQSPGCAALQGRPSPGNPNRRTTPNSHTTPNSPPNGRVSPYRGDPSPKPRVRSPARATKPWEARPQRLPLYVRPTNISPSTPPTKRSAHPARGGDTAQRGRAGDFLVWARCGGLVVRRIARSVLAPILLA